MKYRSSSHWKGIPEGLAKEAIEHILDQRRHPLMVMCKCVSCAVCHTSCYYYCCCYVSMYALDGTNMHTHRTLVR